MAPVEIRDVAPGLWLSFGAVLLIFYAAVGWTEQGTKLAQWARIQWAITIGLADSGADGHHPAVRGAYRGGDDGWYDPWRGTALPTDPTGPEPHVSVSLRPGMRRDWERHAVSR